MRPAWRDYPLGSAALAALTAFFAAESGGGLRRAAGPGAAGSGGGGGAGAGAGCTSDGPAAEGTHERGCLLFLVSLLLGSIDRIPLAAICADLADVKAPLITMCQRNRYPMLQEQEPPPTRPLR